MAKISLFLFFFAKLSYAMDFKLSSSDDINDVSYYSLQINNENSVKNIGLEGNSNDVVIRQYYNFSCQWGNASGVRLGMNSSSTDGPLVFDNIYILDNKLNVVFAKSYSRIKSSWVDPVNLKYAVCNHLSNGLENDAITQKDYIVDFESIAQGPFNLKGAENVSIKYIRDDVLKIIREDENSSDVIDSIKNHNDTAPVVRTVFFMRIASKMNVVSLISWGGDMNEGDYYKVYAYTYDKKGLLHLNKILSEDPRLSGYNTEKVSFKYKNAAAIKKYILEKYNS